MGQSLNLFNKNTSLKYLNDIYIHARSRGLKSTYYLRNKSASEIEKTTNVGDGDNSNASDTDALEPTAAACDIDGTCESCQ